MSDADDDLIFVKDPQRFMEVLWMDDPSERFAALQARFEDLMICEIARFGATNHEDMVQPLQLLFRTHYMTLPLERRWTIYRHVKGLAENVAWMSVNAFLPFITEDDATHIVSTATIDFVSLAPLRDGDPMTAPKIILSLIEQDDIQNVGAAFGGLLSLGDSRVCRLLLTLRDGLDKHQVTTAINCNTEFMHAATVDFYLDWLEGLEGNPDDPDDLFGTVAAGLGRLRRYSPDEFVRSGLRPIPSRGLSPDAWRKAIALIPVDDYVKSIAPRLYALERSEPPPRVMPHVISVWGLEPVTPSSEAADLGDRSGVSPRLETPPPQPPDIETTTDEWGDGAYRIHLLWGKLNPDGPTLYCLGTRYEGSEHRTFFRKLHFLGGFTSLTPATEEKISEGTIFRDLVALHNGLVARQYSGVFDTIPSFLIADAGDPELMDVARAALSGGTVGSADWGRELAYRRQFGDDFFGRAGAEIRAYYEDKVAEAAEKNEAPSEELLFIRARYGHLRDFTDATNPTWTSSTCTPELLDEWLEGIRKPDHASAALGTLREMWEGSASLVPDALKERGIPSGRIIEYIAAGGFRLPESE